MLSDLLALAGTSTAVSVWSKGGVGICSSAMGCTVQSGSNSTKLILSNGSGGQTFEWDASDIAGFAVANP